MAIKAIQTPPIRTQITIKENELTKKRPMTPLSKDWEDLEKVRHLEHTYGIDRFFFVSLLNANETYHPVALSSLSFYARFRRLAVEEEVSEGVKAYNYELEEFV